MRELIENACTGVNIIPTILLVLILIYWVTVIIGVIDLDFLNFDVELDSCTSSEGLQVVLAFLNIKEIPFIVVMSVLVLVFWILSMLLYLLPIAPGGLINGLLLIPTLIISIFITKVVTNPLRVVFKKVYIEKNNEEIIVSGQVTTLLCDIKDGRLGQGEIRRDGASILINVKAKYDDDTFEKYEEAYVSQKDDEKDIYYIVKIGKF